MKRDNTRHRHINSLSAEEITAEFVEDGVKQTPTELRRFVLGIERLARLRHVSQEDAYQEIRGEVVALTGHGLPVG